MSRRKSSLNSFSVAVDVSDRELEDAGWHHEDDCPRGYGYPPGGGVPRDELVEAYTALHQVSHSTQPADPRWCRMRPCRDLNSESFTAQE